MRNVTLAVSLHFFLVLSVNLMAFTLLTVIVVLFTCISLSEQVEQWPCADGKLRFASYYGDHMVLQKSPEKAVIWGCGPPGAQITVFLLGPTEQKTLPATVTNKTGMWRVTLDPVKAGGPYNLTAALEDSHDDATLNNTVTLMDVLFGDVWLCGGQSNMYFQMSQIFNASQELALAARYPHVRFFMAGLNVSETELPDLFEVAIPWSVPTKKDLAPFSAVCWLFGRYLYENLNYPIGLVESSWGGTSVEAWSSLNALQRCGLGNMNKKFFGPTSNSILWNSMIHPLLNMTLKGAIWYQGEANADYHRDLYNCSFPAMIDDWRNAFHEGSGGQTAIDFPFGFVQLSTYQHTSTDDGFPDIRWHQTADTGFVPNSRMQRSFMAVAMDLPDETSPYGTIHPRDKQDVAYRLTLGARAVAYNQKNVSFHGPFPNLILSCKMYVNVTYSQTVSVTPSKDIFQICCSPTASLCGPQSWLSAPIMQWGPTTIQLSSSLCPASDHVVALRYAWRDWPCDFKACPVYSSSRTLPAPPFIINFQSTSGWKREDATGH